MASTNCQKITICFFFSERGDGKTDVSNGIHECGEAAEGYLVIFFVTFLPMSGTRDGNRIWRIAKRRDAVCVVYYVSNIAQRGCYLNDETKRKNFTVSDEEENGRRKLLNTFDVAE